MVDYLTYNNEKIPISIGLMALSRTSDEIYRIYNLNFLDILNEKEKHPLFIPAFVILCKHSIEAGCMITGIPLKKEWQNSELILNEPEVLNEFLMAYLKSQINENENKESDTAEKKMK